MIIIGEKLNSTLKSIRPAMENYDAAAILELAKKQTEAGADYLDVNAGMFYDDEPERLEWLVKTIQAEVNTPFAIDSPNPEALEKALKANTNPKPLINSITDEKERFDSVLPLILEYNTGIVALCMDDTGMPETVEDRFIIADRIIEKLTCKGVALNDIYMDPMVRPVATGSHYGLVAIETIRKIKAEFPGVHIACGLSNVSYGVPMRKLINESFLVAAMAAGMDGAILDPINKKLMAMIYATEALLGKDEYCGKYLKKFKAGFFEEL